MTKETEILGLVFQSENFSYNRLSSCSLESWSDMDCPLDQSKPRLQPGDDLAAITMLYEQCKSQKDQKSMSATRTSVCKSTERALANTQEHDSPASVLRILSDSIPSSYPEDVPCCKHATSVHPVPDNYTTLTSVMADAYDKHELSLFDALLQRWPDTGAYADPTAERALAYTEPFPEEQSSPVYSGSYTGSPEKHFRKEFQFSLGVPPATPYKASELPMAYLNKGQFYPITLHGMDNPSAPTPAKVKTVVMAVFENDKTPETQLRFWNHWHARQPTVRQRVIDIADYKEIYSNISDVEEVAFNALSFIWSPHEEAKVFIGINSLSTDFSSQKGIKGQPLTLQIDTYDFSSGTNLLIHRAACQVKIFCDKGAERKMRDEERKRTKRRGKTFDPNVNGLVSSSVNDSTFFQSLDDHVSVPVLFIPETHLSSMRMSGPAVNESERGALKRSCPDREQSSSLPNKLPKQDGPQRVLLYVRTRAEEVFDALLLTAPTLRGLREALSLKYGMQAETIGKIFKKCKRGIFVNMDDTIIEHYTNQSAFLLEMSECAGLLQLTLEEV